MIQFFGNIVFIDVVEKFSPCFLISAALAMLSKTEIFPKENERSKNQNSIRLLNLETKEKQEIQETQEM